MHVLKEFFSGLLEDLKKYKDERPCGLDSIKDPPRWHLLKENCLRKKFFLLKKERESRKLICLTTRRWYNVKVMGPTYTALKASSNCKRAVESKGDRAPSEAWWLLHQNAEIFLTCLTWLWSYLLHTWKYFKIF